MCKWRQEDESKPSFVPRMGSGISGLTSGPGVIVLQLENNKMKIVDTLSDTVTASVQGLARNHRGYPGGLKSFGDNDRLIMNGGSGQVQVFRTSTENVYSMDITQQNRVSKERLVEPHNSEVERLTVSDNGGYMATVDCTWAGLARILLKLWTWSEEVSNYVLNTQVEFPHFNGVQSMSFQPLVKISQTAPLLLTVGNDNKAKLWQLDNSWSCAGCLQFRSLPALSGDWSSDGTVIGIAFGHLVTLWSSLDMTLKTTLAVKSNKESITNLVFGRNTCSRYLFSCSLSNMIMWDLITLSPAWSLPLSPSLHTSISQSPSLPLAAVIQKDTIQIISPNTMSIIKTFDNVNCSGGADWLDDSLYFLKYSGELIKASRDNFDAVSDNTVMDTLTGNSWMMKTGINSTYSFKVEPKTRSRQIQDLESMLALPLHTVPAPSVLSQTLVR